MRKCRIITSVANSCYQLGIEIGYWQHFHIGNIPTASLEDERGDGPLPAGEGQRLVEPLVLDDETAALDAAHERAVAGDDEDVFSVRVAEEDESGAVA